MKTKQVNVYRNLTALVIMAVVSLMLIVHPAAADGTRVDFENYNIACSISSQEISISNGGIIHIRNRVLNSVVTSTSPYHEGPGHIFGNANITDPATGVGTYFGSLDIYPTAYPDGYWFGNWSMQIRADGFHGIARLKGYGSLEGMLSFATLIPMSPVQLADYSYLCGGSQPVAGTHVFGYYIVTGGE